MTTTAADVAACFESLRHGSHSFFAASFLLPKALRAPASALYAFCRMADDAIDLDEGGEQALAMLRERLDRAYASRPWPNPVDRAFSHVVLHYSIPHELPEALLEGFAWDAAHRRYQTIEELRAYAARVAGTVGAMMSLLMGARAPEVVARACDLGVAMQLTNIARDVGEDARAGRLYLPLTWLEEAGVDAGQWLSQPCYAPQLTQVVARLLESADELYARAAAGIRQLPLGCRPAIHAARLLYSEIGREVERRELDSVTGRAVVAKSRKVVLLAGALGATAWPRPSINVAALRETQFLVEAVAAHPIRETRAPIVLPSEAPWWDLGSRVEWVLQLFEQLDERQRVDRVAGDT